MCLRFSSISRVNLACLGIKVTLFLAAEFEVSPFVPIHHVVSLLAPIFMWRFPAVDFGRSRTSASALSLSIAVDRKVPRIASCLALSRSFQTVKTRPWCCSG
jgi:hypothetical protein